MVQVSYPGVYVQEVPSGARTITGVSTAIAAFVGMTKRGPLLKPTTVLGFNDYVRVFSADTSQGELTDQVRQFFLNGGQQAVIVRVAEGAQAASTTIGNAVPPSGGTATIALRARSAGLEGRKLRARVDYNTGSPERTFNLTIYEELINSSGVISVGASETFGSLTLDPTDARFVQRFVESNSQLVDLATVTNTAPNPGSFSAGALLGDISDALGDLLRTAPYGNASGGSGSFRLRVGTRQAVDVTLTAGADPAPVSQGDIQSAIDQVLPSIGLAVGDVDAVIAGAAGSQFLRLETLLNEDIRIERAPAADLARPLGLGEAQGGIEVSSRAGHRPLPNGFASVLGGNALTTLLGVAAAEQVTFTGTAFGLSGPAGFSVPAGAVSFSGPGGTLAHGSAASDLSLLNVRQNLQVIAEAINAVTDDWRAEVHGYRLVLIPISGNSQSGTGHTATGGLATILAGATQLTAAAAFAGGDDGDVPNAATYAEAYERLDREVDLFNLLVLPKNDGADRSDFWGAASSFAQSRRAFLLIDAEAEVDSVDEAVEAVKQARIGVVKDHAALYWPALRINPDGAPRFVDPSGTIAGLMSRIDSNRGVWKAPAGLEADLRGVSGVRVPMSDAENGRLNPQALNAIRVFPNGIVSWGARTLDGFDNSGNDDFKYVPVRRFTLFLEESLLRGLKFAVFEPNDEPLWAQIRLAAGAFMNNLFRRGAFAGRTTREAYFVKADAETTTQNDINLGIVNVVVGFAPLKPAEFIVITIQQKAGQVQV